MGKKKICEYILEQQLQKMGATPRVWEKRKTLKLFTCRCLRYWEEGSHWAGTQTHGGSASWSALTMSPRWKQWGQLCKYWENCKLEPNGHYQSKELLPWWRSSAWVRWIGAGVRWNGSVLPHSASLAISFLSLGQHPAGSSRQSRRGFRVPIQHHKREYRRLACRWDAILVTGPVGGLMKHG